MSNQAAAEAILDALGDPTRRRIVERLGHGPVAVGDLAAQSLVQTWDQALTASAGVPPSRRGDVPPIADGLTGIRGNRTAARRDQPR